MTQDPGAARALEAFGAPSSLVEAARRLGPDEFLFFGNPPARVDLLRSIPGVAFAEAYPRRLDVPWGDLTVHVIGKADLIAAKRAAGRERDRRDLDALEREG